MNGQYQVRSPKQDEFYQDRPQFVNKVYDTVFRKRKGSKYLEIVQEMFWKEFKVDHYKPIEHEEREFLKVCLQSLEMVEQYFDGHVNYYCNSIQEYARQRNKDEQDNRSTLEHLFG